MIILKSSRIPLYETRQVIAEYKEIFGDEEFTARDLHGLFPHLELRQITGLLQKADSFGLVTKKKIKSNYERYGTHMVGLYRANV